MDVFVVVATKGRAAECCDLLSWLAAQTLPPANIVFVGSQQSDLQGIAEHELARSGRVLTIVANRAGSSLQRNVGVYALGTPHKPFCVVFLDDDFRPADDWLEQCVRFFEERPDAVGLTGWVLADGVRGHALRDDDAREYISGARTPQKHWASGSQARPIECVYGCNMAFRDVAIESCRFDETLPLYGWQEDQDYTAQAARFGRVFFVPSCRGVHLGSKGARSSGVRLGYSQIANPIYLMQKGTMPRRKGVKFLVRALASNTLRSLWPHPLVDYPGRLAGNARAVLDLTRGRCHPTRVLDFV
jgi:GT2 family glycosyltransferase